MSARGEKLLVRPGKAKQAARKTPACPICRKPASPEHRPFCSRHCADIDLSRWLGGRYAIPGEPVEAGPTGQPEPDDDEGPVSARRTRQGGGDFL
jgi:uncharacterized protein